MSLGLIRSSTRNIASVYSQDIDIQNYLKSNNLKANILKYNGISGKNGPPREVRDYIIKNNVHTIFITTLDRFSRDRKTIDFLVKHKIKYIHIIRENKIFSMQKPEDESEIYSRLIQAQSELESQKRRRIENNKLKKMEYEDEEDKEFERYAKNRKRRRMVNKISREKSNLDKNQIRRLQEFVCECLEIKDDKHLYKISKLYKTINKKEDIYQSYKDNTFPCHFTVGDIKWYIEKAFLDSNSNVNKVYIDEFYNANLDFWSKYQDNEADFLDMSSLSMS